MYKEIPQINKNNNNNNNKTQAREIGARVKKYFINENIQIANKYTKGS